MISFIPFFFHIVNNLKIGLSMMTNIKRTKNFFIVLRSLQNQSALTGSIGSFDAQETDRLNPVYCDCFIIFEAIGKSDRSEVHFSVFHLVQPVWFIYQYE